MINYHFHCLEIDSCISFSHRHSSFFFVWQFVSPPKTGMRRDAHTPGICHINTTVTSACFRKNMNWPFCCSFSVLYLRKHSQLQNLAVSPFLHKRQILFCHCWSVKLLRSLIFPLAQWDFIWNVTVFATMKISAFQKQLCSGTTNAKQGLAQRFGQRSSIHSFSRAVGLDLASLPSRINHFRSGSFS